MNEEEITALGKKIGNPDFSDEEGEEMLTCDRDVVRMLYDRTDSVKVRQALESIFGSKCLPDELNEDNFAKSEPKNEGTRQKQCVPKNAESGTHSFSHILKDGFHDNDRLHIAAQITASIYSNKKTASRFDSIEALVRKALDITDTLIAEAERTDKLNK